MALGASLILAQPAHAAEPAHVAQPRPAALQQVATAETSCFPDMICHTIAAFQTVTDVYTAAFDTPLVQVTYHFGPVRTDPTRIELPYIEIKDVQLYDMEGGIALSNGDMTHLRVDAGKSVIWWVNDVMVFPFRAEINFGTIVKFNAAYKIADFLPSGEDWVLDCGTGIYKDFFGAFQVGSQACAYHLSLTAAFAPYIRVRLDSAAPWRFTKCTVNWAYRKALDGTVFRPPAVDCTHLINVMLDLQITSITGMFMLGQIYSRYLELWGHVTVRFDHTDWNVTDFHYLQTI